MISGPDLIVLRTVFTILHPPCLRLTSVALLTHCLHLHHLPCRNEQAQWQREHRPFCFPFSLRFATTYSGRSRYD